MKTIRSFLGVMAGFLARASIGRRGGGDDAPRSRRGRPWRRVCRRRSVASFGGGEKQSGERGRKGERKRATAAAERKGLGQQ